ncbi:MAG TPA: tripartite tricarboxylate transporter substrate-binding protein [Candidatus Eisenbacteria bacterium]|nr:tripartite tricarboxylate transporter substrate-binding protein [Candidatus Eisenbacteria bacterium]
MARALLYLISAVTIFSLGASHGWAQESFYKGKVIRIIEAYSAGGGYDAYARLLARHMGRHIPGKPALVVENMTGAGGLIAVNYLYNRAEPDGLTMGNWNGALSLQQYLGRQGIEFDAPKFGWVGSPLRPTPLCVLSKSTGVTGVSEWMAAKKPIKLGGMAPGTSLSDDARVLQTALGLPLQLVEGYKGGADVKLAIGQGEIQGACGLAWQTQKATWQQELKTMNIVLQVGRKPHPELPKVPLVYEFAKTDDARQLLKVGIQDLSALGHAYTLPPGVRKDRLETLRKAFAATMRDPEFLADAQRSKIIIEPTPGEELEQIVASFSQLSPEIRGKLKAILLPAK